MKAFLLIDTISIDIISSIFIAFSIAFSFLHPLALFADESDSRERNSKRRTVSVTLAIKGHERKLEIEIHSTREDEGIARRVEAILREWAPPLIKYFSYVPRDTVHLVIDSQMRTANGFAAVWPRNSILLYNFPPLGKEHLHVNDDWPKSLVVHEFIHILHMEQTHGILQVLRTVFGSVSKQGGLVPRWFSEGIAVWGESMFLPRGRLHSDSLEYELRTLLERDDFCQTIDCLDDPGKYPYGQYPYWIGAYFLDFIEKKKRGAISCIVKNNSYSLPFLLHSSFKICLGDGVENVFEAFRNSYKKKIVEDKEDFQNSFLKKLPIDQTKQAQMIDWQKGVAYVKKNLFYAIREGFAVKLAQRGIENKNEEKVHPLLSERLAMIPPPSPYSRRTGLFPIATYRSPFGVEKKWAILNSENKTLKGLKFKRVPDYLFLLGEDRFLSMIFYKNHWRLYIEDEEIYTFPYFTSIAGPQIFIKDNRPWLAVRSYDSNDPNETFQFLQIDFTNSRKTSNFLRLETPFIILGQCGDHFMLKEGKDTLHLVNMEGKKNKTLTASWLRGLFFWENDQNSNVLASSQWPGEFLWFKGHCETLLGQMKMKMKMKTKEEISVEQSPKPIKKIGKRGKVGKEQENKETRPYPSLHHFLPHYWGLFYLREVDLDFLQFFTSLSDPANLHTIDLNFHYYPQVSMGAPNVRYRYRMNYLTWGLNYEKSFFSNLIDPFKLDSIKSKKISLSFSSLNLSNWSYLPTIGLGLLNIDDHISRRVIQEYSIYQRLSRTATHHNSFLQGFQWNGHLFYRQAQESGDGFMGTTATAHVFFKWQRRLSTQFSSTYGEIFNKRRTSDFFMEVVVIITVVVFCINFMDFPMDRPLAKK